MNADLEATLKELGPEYSELAWKMKSAFAPEPVQRRVRVGYLLAASLAVVLALASLVRLGSGSSEVLSPVGRDCDGRINNEYALAFRQDQAAVSELLRTQRADGGWGNEFLTRQNIAALRVCGDPAARIAVKRGMRHLRLAAKGY